MRGSLTTLSASKSLTELDHLHISQDEPIVTSRTAQARFQPVASASSFGRLTSVIDGEEDSLSESSVVEGKNLLKQRNALHRVGGSSHTDGRTPPPARKAYTPSPEPCSSPRPINKRKSFKASLFRMINVGGGRHSVTSDEDCSVVSPSSPGMSRVKSLPSFATNQLGPADQQDNSVDRNKKAPKKWKKDDKELEERDRSKPAPLPVWAMSGSSVSEENPDDEATSRGALRNTRKQLVHSQNSSSTSEFELMSPVPEHHQRSPAKQPESALESWGMARETPNEKTSASSTINRMRDTPMGMGLGKDRADSGGKPSLKPKPSTGSSISSTSSTSKPPLPKKPTVARSKSAAGNRNNCIGSASTQDSASSKAGFSSSSTDSETALPELPPTKFNKPCSPKARASSGASRASAASAGEVTQASEVGSAGRDSVPVCPAGTDEDSDTMLYQTYQVVSTSAAAVDRNLTSGSPPAQVLRPHGQSAIYEEQLQQMHSDIYVSVNKHRRKNMRWEDQPRVRNSLALPDLTRHEHELQQRYFEVVSSEKSYNQSLKVLVVHFMESEALSSSRLIDAHTRHSLFSNVKSLLEVSNRLLADLEERVQSSIVVPTVCDILKEHVDRHFEPFVLYCSNQAYQMRTLENLLKGEDTKKAIMELERRKEAQGLPLVSFVLLPMQRVTRLKLLVDAILKATPDGHEMRPLTADCLKSLHNCVDRCNEGAKAMKRTEDLIELNKKVDFGKVKPLALVSHKSPRWVLRTGPVNYINKEKKNKTSEVHLIALNDLLLIAKAGRKKNTYRIIDYCYSPFLAVEREASLDSSAARLFRSASDGAINKVNCNATEPTLTENKYFRVTLLENSTQVVRDYLFEARAISEKLRWVEALCPESDEDGDERVYESWDCPEVIALYQYLAKQPDELSIEPGDVITVRKKMKDGWHQGQSCRTNQMGWFPGEYVKERESAHSRARTLRKQHQIKATSTDDRPGSFINSAIQPMQER